LTNPVFSGGVFYFRVCNVLEGNLYGVCHESLGFIGNPFVELLWPPKTFVVAYALAISHQFKIFAINNLITITPDHKNTQPVSFYPWIIT
jgi:hypothetical protein